MVAASWGARPKSIFWRKRTAAREMARPAAIPPANQKAERAVQANGCKKQSETAEECRERSEKAVFDQRSVNLLGEGVEFKGDAFVHLGDRLLDGGGESGGA